MGRSRARLDTYSSAYVLHPFTVSAAEWDRLGSFLFPPVVPEELRAAIEDACDLYLDGRQAEIGAGSVTDAKARLDRMRRQADEFAELAGSLHDYATDDAASVSKAVQKAVKGERATVGALDFCGSFSTEWGQFSPPSGIVFGVRPDPTLLVDLSRIIQRTLARAAQDMDRLENERGGFEKGLALTAWILRVRGIFRGHNAAHPNSEKYVISGLNGGVDPTSFAAFMYEIHHLMPGDLRDTISGHALMGERIKAAISEERKAGGPIETEEPA